MSKQFFLIIILYCLLLAGCTGRSVSNIAASSSSEKDYSVLPDTKQPVVYPIDSKQSVVYPVDVKQPKLSERELMLISQRIYFNETSARRKNLIIWNENEKFVSLGIGHFIWYPEGVNKRFDETFPRLLDYLQKNQVRIPFWLQSARERGAPWKTKPAFLASQYDPELRELRRILQSTKELQTLFFLNRIHQSIPEILSKVSASQREKVKNNYNALANTKGGWYPLIDYINFKGTGLKVTEHYQNQGWGMLHVLQEMPRVEVGTVALNEFSQAALRVLQRRINNSPKENNEDRWLAGWTKRVNSYKDPLVN
ncbi:MAG: hypothetical protein KAH22_05700 [Thiotrichaceae bacterium]|nr:hypothetical protein [Thiotrichaceae bacterium]